MSKLHVRNAGMGGNSASIVELEYGFIRSSSGCADGCLGEEERDEVQKGFWGKVSEEAVQHVAWDLVGMGLGEYDYRLSLVAGRVRREE